MTEGQDYWTNEDFKNLGYTPAITEERIRLSRKINNCGEDDKKGKECPVLAIKPGTLDFIIHRAQDRESALSLADRLPEELRKKVKMWLTYDGNTAYSPEKIRAQVKSEKTELPNLLVPIAAAACSVGFFMYPQLAHAYQAVVDYFK